MDYGMTFGQALEAMERELEGEWEQATEADGTITLTTQATKSATTDQANNNLADTEDNSPQALMKKVKSQTEKTTKSLTRTNRQTLKMLQNTWTSNENFIAEYGQMVEQYKLKDEYRAINWSYGHNAEQYLYSKLTQLRAIINTNLGHLNNFNTIPEDSLLNKAGIALDKALVEGMGAPSSIDTPKEFMGHLRTQFRGRKSEKTYKGDMANSFAQEIRSFAKTKTSYTQNIQAAQRMITTLDSLCNTHMKNGSMGDQEKKRVLVLQRNGSGMIVLYLNMIYFCYRLHVEYILNRRALLSRLFEK
jgi:hypothetical protein